MELEIHININIFIPEGTRCCHDYLNRHGKLLQDHYLHLQYFNTLYKLNGKELQNSLNMWEASKADSYSDHTTFSEEDLKTLNSVTREQFQELFTFYDPVSVQTNVHRYVTEKHLLLFLKLRQRLSDDFLKVIFNYTSRKAVSIDNLWWSILLRLRNNDAAMLRSEFERDADALRQWLDKTAILILLIVVTETSYQGQRQLETQEANDSRLVTKNRWIIEARNKHIKSMFKFFKNIISVVHTIHLHDK